MAGIPTAEQEALQAPTIDPVFAATTGFTGGLGTMGKMEMQNLFSHTLADFTGAHGVADWQAKYGQYINVPNIIGPGGASVMNYVPRLPYRMTYNVLDELQKFGASPLSTFGMLLAMHLGDRAKAAYAKEPTK